MDPRLAPLTEILSLNTRLFRNCLEGVTDEKAAMRPSASTNSPAFVAAHVTEARFYLLKMLGADYPSPIAAYLEGARGIDDVKRLPPLAEIQRAWTTASHELRERLDRMTAAELDASIACPFPLPISDTMAADAIRDQFPALRREHRGHPVAYFDGPGGTQVPAVVVDRMRDYLLHHNANTHWAYPTSEETDAAIADARGALADFLGASPEEVAFGANMTTLTFHVSRALARQWQAGDEVIVTELDHYGNVDPWRAVARDHGLTIRSVPMNTATGELEWNALERAFSPRTKLLAIGAASNILGTITDVAAAARLARAAGAQCFVDAVHYAPHVPVDVRAIGCDLLVCSPDKFYGPHLGAMYVRRDLLERLDVPKVEPAAAVGPERLETGTLSHEAIAGAAAAVDFLASLANDAGSRRDGLVRTMAALHERGLRQVTRLWEALRAIPGVTVYGPPPSRPRTSTISFVVAGLDSTAVAHHCADRGLFVSNGDFYATTVARRLGHGDDGLVRLGCAAYTSDDEVERAIAAIAEIADRSAVRRRTP